MARVVVPHYPHHITHRGNRRQQTFFCNEDHTASLALMAEWCDLEGGKVWSYCLMVPPAHTAYS